LVLERKSGLFGLFVLGVDNDQVVTRLAVDLPDFFVQFLLFFLGSFFDFLKSLPLFSEDVLLQFFVWVLEGRLNFSFKSLNNNVEFCSKTAFFAFPCVM
jgi:hypothetical protein